MGSSGVRPIIAVVALLALLASAAPPAFADTESGDLRIAAWRISGNKLFVDVANDGAASHGAKVTGVMSVAGVPYGFSSTTVVAAGETRTVVFHFPSVVLSLQLLDLQQVAGGGPGSTGAGWNGANGNATALSESNPAAPGTEGPDPIP